MLEIIKYNFYYQVMNIDFNEKIKNSIKAKIIENNYTMKTLAPVVAKKFNNPHFTVANLSYKLNKGTLKYSEAMQIADVLGYNIIWVEK